MDVKVIHARNQFIHLMVSPKEDADWQLTIVYASPRPTERKVLWSDL